MEPVRGGMLNTLCPEAAALLHQAAPEKSLASWAIRWVASLPNVLCVLSGMTTLEQVQDNVASMDPFIPLSTTEQDTQSHEDHICLVGGAIDIAHLFGGSFYFEFCSGQFENITGVDHCLSKYRNIDACSLDTADTDSVHEFLCPDFGYRFPGKSPVGHHYRKSFCREVE